MRRGNLFEPPKSFTNRIEGLHRRGLERSKARLLLQVELGFALMEFLQLDDEPVTAVWAILSRMPLRHLRLQNLTREQRRAIANARQIIPYSARFTWLNALQTYIQNIPLEHRNYTLTTEYLQDLNQRIINAYKQERHAVHQALYEDCLTTQLTFALRERNQVAADNLYEFNAETGIEPIPTTISFEQTQLEQAEPVSRHWFPPPLDRAPFSIHIDALHDDAVYLDEREENLAQRFDWRETDKGNWVNRWQKISFHKIQEDGELGDRNTESLTLDGFVHLPGMVASGKSTLSLLLAAHLLRHYPEQRLTLVVGDVQSALKLANQINDWFREDPEHDDPVAVALLGHSTRETHLKAFHASKDYQDHRKREQPHWGERWLGTACPLQGLLQLEEIIKLDGQPLTLGKEPCYSLRGIPASNQSDDTNDDDIDNADNEKWKRRCLCPFFSTCPSQQAYRDMPQAPIWITTPGAMAMAGLPRHLELRRIKLGELIYEQSDIVIFDEADTIIEWFDHTYAETVTLTNGKNGVFDTINTETEQYMVANRVPPSLTQRWVGAQRDAQKVVTATLTLLSQGSRKKWLREWTQRGYFTPNSLCFKLARRIAGLEEFDQPGTPESQRTANQDHTRQVMRHFNRLLDSDPLQRQAPSNPKDAPVYRLARLMQDINATGESATNYLIHRTCKAWIRDFYPDMERQLEQLRTEVRNRLTPSAQRAIEKGDQSDPVDTLETLAYRLQFAITIALLDRHTRIVFYEWQHRPPEIEEESPHRRMPTAMLNILPLPPTGRQFGTYYSHHNDDRPEETKPLSLFAYTNIGRCYILNFHRLLTDLDGRRGPNVLALSGTSYLPDSTQFHVGTQNDKPYGVLMPEETAKVAIAQSHFEFLPQFRTDEEPMRISGKPEKEKPNLFREVTRSLVGNNGRGHLGQQLEELQKLGKGEPKCWQDRERILLLVNSYDQSRWVAQEIRRCWSNMRQSVHHLISDKQHEASENDQSEQEAGALRRSDIETFGQTDGKILVAPMSAIGRGFNILNANNKAAFGAVYFLARPYPHPHDTQAIAQEMNRRVLDWEANPDFMAWQEDGIQQRANALRKCAARYWRIAENRSYYRTLSDREDLSASPRKDLAAKTAGLIIQAVGRLLRGGVPFHAFFVDAAWAPKYAGSQTVETPETSLLAAIIDLLTNYVGEDQVCQALYEPLADAISSIEEFEWTTEPRDKQNA